MNCETIRCRKTVPRHGASRRVVVKNKRKAICRRCHQGALNAARFAGVTVDVAAGRAFGVVAAPQRSATWDEIELVEAA